MSWAATALTGNQAIPGCTTGGNDNIYEWIQAVGQNGPVGGFTAWNATLGHSCDLASGDPAIAVTGNVRIDCPSFTVRNNVSIVGDVILDGDVMVTSSGHLNVDNSLGSPGTAFFRDGLLSKGGSAHLTFNYTAVYISRTSQLTMAAGAGSLTWIAPDSGIFDDLALWSDSPLVQSWAGQAGLTMEGVFFMPLARVDYSGSSGQNQTNAQWIAYALTARGGGTLVVRPAVDRSVPTGLLVTTLIR
jgi:hypothetical protein